MPRFAANVTTMFREMPFSRRFDAAASEGFTAVEMQFPYSHRAEDLSVWAQNAGVEIALINCPPGNWDAGDRGLAALPGREHDFRESVALGLRYARILGAAKLHIMAGLTTQGAAREIYVQNLTWAAAEAGRAGVLAVLEAINPIDMPNYFVNRQANTASVVEEIGSPYLALQMDCYHMGMMGEDVVATLGRYRHLCGHVQIADVPGRHEPGTGTLNYPAVFQALDDLGYQGWTGCEYTPAGDTRAGLTWLKHSLGLSY